jgi:ankyrin repeat protein
LPAEIKSQILDEVWLLDPSNGYKELLNVALSCHDLCKHALPKLYFKDARESLELDYNLDMPLALQWACWYGVLKTAKLSLVALKKTGLIVEEKMSTPFSNTNLYELRHQSAKRRGRPNDLAHGYLHWGSRIGLLHLACLRGNTAVAELLMNIGVHPDTVDGHATTPLAHALNEEVVSYTRSRN